MKGMITVCDPLIDFWEEMKIKVQSKISDFTPFDAIIFAVPHIEFSKIDFSSVSISKQTLIFDANNVLTKTQKKYLLNNKLNYASIGRG